MTGLTSKEAYDRYIRGYSNVQIDNTQKTKADILRENICTYFNAIFLILAILLIVAGSFRSLTFLPVIIANTLIGIFQELKAKKILDNLSVLNEPNAQVIRDGKEVTLPVQELVLDDVIVLRNGCQIPADGVVLSGEVNVNEALLTGEADEIKKEQGSQLMSGSFVVNGLCYAKLTKVGASSYISQLTLKAKKMSSTEQSDMIKSINHIVIAAGIAIIPVGIALFWQGLSQGNGFSASITSMVAAVIGMIPEGLYLLVSIALAMSAAHLASQKVMLHNMKSIETLARVDTLCVDKTGTITDNSMLVAKVIPVNGRTMEQETSDRIHITDYITALSDDNQTMQALRNYFIEMGSADCVASLPFTSVRKYSGVQFKDGTYLLGAPEIILKKNYAHYSEFVNAYASKGLRVLVFAQFLGNINPETILSIDKSMLSLPIPESGLGDENVLPVMFILLQNPIRENAPKTFKYFKSQGVGIKVISGDNPVTVSEVARQAGIAHSEKYVDARTLKEEADYENAVKKYTVFGRVQPEQKQMIVRALKKIGHKVAMTGDGVNDILAMKDADCSIAMAAGSDAAVQAAQIVLLDSDFSKMEEIVSEGRRDINNITRSATLFLVKNIFSLLLSIFAIISVMTYPLQPSQISFISMFNIGIPAFFLALEKNTKRSDGKFIINVLVQSLPAALTDFFAIAALVLFGDTFGVTPVDVSVAATFVMVIVGFMILARICMPLNKFRLRIIIGCIIGMIFTAFTLSDLFAITYISKECVMLFVLFVIATEPCMRYLTLLLGFLEKKGRHIYKKIQKRRKARKEAKN
ncbi:HAD-IC family P-type ATPase [Butyrivibrio sp. NC3005]|uniref:HAD-IC family P-type ATPase n=1 Tax=Butyrivibrio sp. NC3005 TaxID=1280685 RepID=UPI0004111F46|nr:HAD-IC family P-type ATPase [Butyrivibrio sp. NC3005]